MKYPEIQSLYKYMPWNKFTKASLEQGTFWFASPTKFNDPLDCGISLNTKGNTPILKDLLTSGFTEIGIATGNSIRNPTDISSIVDSIKQFANNITENADLIKTERDEATKDQHAYETLKSDFSASGILSLSELGDNILMWSHYAQQHEGICIEFERSQNNILGLMDITLPVRYSIKAPIIDAKRYRTTTKEEQIEIEQSLVLTKAADWTYEREWRVLKNGCANSLQSLDCKIRSITLGLRAGDDVFEYISLLTKLLDFQVKRATLKPNEFGLIVAPI